jgi:hypothetical protein
MLLVRPAAWATSVNRENGFDGGAGFLKGEAGKKSGKKVDAHKDVEAFSSLRRVQ